MGSIPGLNTSGPEPMLKLSLVLRSLPPRLGRFTPLAIATLLSVAACKPHVNYIQFNNNILYYYVLNLLAVYYLIRASFLIFQLIML